MKNIPFFKSFPTSIVPLVIFRILFGGILCLAAARTLWYDWVDKFYIQPDFHFKFFGFFWVEPLPAWAMYALFIGLFLSGLAVSLGFYYRYAISFFFIGFVYAELLDVTHYLNHYYLISCLCFILIWLPAHQAYSLDTWRGKAKKRSTIPIWMIRILQLQVSIVYIYAGIAKLEVDWLFNAQPIYTWLIQRTDTPIIGSLFYYKTTAFIFAWFGLLYDLTIPFWLWWRRSRAFAFMLVIVFHVMTRMLFPIGVFPWMMIIISTIFASASFHQKIIRSFADIFNLTLSKLKQEEKIIADNTTVSKWVLAVFLSFQLFFPLRHWLYSGNVLWTEEGFRFSWRVMLVDKHARITFRVVDTATGKESWINNLDYLTEKQEYMMASQADLILQFAHHLAADYEKRYQYKEPQVYADAFVALNGRTSQRFIKKDTNLAKQRIDLWHKEWILPLAPSPY